MCWISLSKDKNIYFISFFNTDCCRLLNAFPRTPKPFTLQFINIMAVDDHHQQPWHWPRLPEISGLHVFWKSFGRKFSTKTFSEDIQSRYFTLAQTIYSCVWVTITTPIIIIIISCIVFVIPVIVVTSNMGKLLLCFCSSQERMYAYMHI